MARRTDGGEEAGEGNSNIFKCRKCSREFQNRHKRYRHEKNCSAEAEEAYRCAYCGREFARNNNRDLHQIVCPGK